MSSTPDANTPDEPIGDEVLMAYADGALAPAERAAVAEALARNPSLRHRLESFDFTRGPLARAFNSTLTAPLPQHLLALVGDSAPMPARRRPAPSGSGRLRRLFDSLWTPALSPAAAIPAVLVGVAAGWLLQGALRTDFVTLDGRGLVASASVQAALDATPAGASADVGAHVRLQPKFTFASQQKTWCRQYELILGEDLQAGGLACREQGAWKVIVQTAAAPRSETRGATVPAGQGDEVLDGFRASIKEGDVLDRGQEERLIRERWSARP